MSSIYECNNKKDKPKRKVFTDVKTLNPFGLLLLRIIN